MPGVHEICDNCIDDDGNGLTDFEDPACCQGVQQFAMAVGRARITPEGPVSFLRLKTLLARTGLEHVNPLAGDNVTLQIRQEGGGEVLCARIPAEKFMRMHGEFKFWDRQHTVASAKHIDDLAVHVGPGRTVKLRTLGKRVLFQSPSHGALIVTVGFRNPATAESGNHCSRTTQPLETGPTGGLRFP